MYLVCSIDKITKPRESKLEKSKIFCESNTKCLKVFLLRFLFFVALHLLRVLLLSVAFRGSHIYFRHSSHQNVTISFRKVEFMFMIFFLYTTISPFNQSRFGADWFMLAWLYCRIIHFILSVRYQSCRTCWRRAWTKANGKGSSRFYYRTSACSPALHCSTFSPDTATT